jgi:hypothetical protein
MELSFTFALHLLRKAQSDKPDGGSNPSEKSDGR